MRADVLLVSAFCVALGACASPEARVPTGETPEPEKTVPSEPTSVPEPSVDAKPSAAKVTVAMASATLADDCGFEVDHPPPPAPDPVEGKPTAPVWRKGATSDEAPAAGAKSKRRQRCEQTTMQLSITATPGAPVKVTVKKVEVFDESGKSLGLLTAREPAIWSQSESYAPWDERIVASGQYSVSYALSQPAWGSEDRRNKTYLVRAVVSVDGEDQSVNREVALQKEVTIQAPTSLPAMVKT